MHIATVIGPTRGTNSFARDGRSSTKFGIEAKFTAMQLDFNSSFRILWNELLGTPVMTKSDELRALLLSKLVSTGRPASNLNGPLTSKDRTSAPSFESIIANGLPITSLLLNIVTRLFLMFWPSGNRPSGLAILQPAS